MKQFKWMTIVFLSISFFIGLTLQARAVCPTNFMITTASPLPDGTEGSQYSHTLQTNAGPQEIVAFLLQSGQLPPNLAINNNTGLISGIPSSTGTFNFTVTATCQQSGSSGPIESPPKTFSLTIGGKGATLGQFKPGFKPDIAQKRPKIESALPVPAGPYKKGSSPGVLRPGFKLYLKGKNFGVQPGKIMMMGKCSDNKACSVYLDNVVWESSTKANGVIPYSTNGQPNQMVKIRVISKKLKPSNNKFDVSNVSDPYNMKFEGRQEATVSKYTAKVSCGTDGNYNFCNTMSTDCPNDIAMCGYHRNMKLAVGNDTGYDNFNITLKNGWVFKSMQKVLWKKTSGDEVLNGPKTPLPVGKSNWNTSIWWVASPGDYVYYKIKVLVEGPFGTIY